MRSEILNKEVEVADRIETCLPRELQTGELAFNSTDLHMSIRSLRPTLHAPRSITNFVENRYSLHVSVSSSRLLNIAPNSNFFGRLKILFVVQAPLKYLSIDSRPWKKFRHFA